MRFPFPLRYSFPALLFCIGLGLSILSIIYEVKVFSKAVEVLIERHANFTGNQVSGLAAYFYGQQDLAGLKKQISQLGADVALKTALVCDPSNQVVVSSRFDYASRTLASTHLAYAASSIPGLKGASTTFSADRRTILGLFPFHLPPEEGDLVSSRQGVLILEYDLTHPKQQAFRTAIDRSKAVVISLAALTLLMWLCFHFFLNRRMQRLVSATQRLAEGETKNVATGIRGSDEVAHLSKAFEEMAQKISGHTLELQNANERMRHEMDERVLVQTALASSERRFRSIWENSQDPMRLTDGNGSVIAVNSAYCELAGMNAEDLVHRPFTTPYAPSGQNLLGQYQADFASRRMPLRQQQVIAFQNGRNPTLEAAYSYVDMGMGQLFLLAIFRDITDRILAVKELQKAKDFSENLIRTANVLIIGLDHRGRIHIFNETAEKTLGWKKDEVLGKSWVELFIAETEQQKVNEAFRNVKAGGCRTYENKVLTRSGAGRIVSWQNNEMVENGKVIGTLSFGIDLTEQREEEERRLEFETKLQETQKLESLGVLAGGIAHDFNNLLTAILGNAGLAAMQLPADSPVRPMLATIEKTSMRAADLCRQMLAYSGKGKLASDQLDLNDLIQDTTQLLEISISKKAGLVFNLYPVLPAVECDPTQIRQVLMNLVINASEALEEKEGKITIQTGLIEANSEYLAKTHLSPDIPAGDYVFFEVSDTGCGMSPETQAKIFDPFFTTKFTGRGLGLAAVLGIVRSHKGALKLRSEPGKGSVFRVLLPAVLSSPRKLETSSALQAPFRAKGTILIVDDDQQVREVTFHMLRHYGFEVLQAVDGADGVEKFREHQSRIDAVLLDMTMPRLDGSETFREIRSLDPKAKVFLMSGYTELEGSSFLKQDGWSGFLQKPFKPEDVARKLQAAIGI